MSIFAIKIGEKGEFTTYGKNFALKDLVGGWVEMVQPSKKLLKKNVSVYVNETGKLENLPVNPFSRVFGVHEIYGPIILTMDDESRFSKDTINYIVEMM